MQTTIQITVKNVYGQTTIYPYCETAKKLCRLTKKKTFDNADLTIIESLGYVIEQVTEPIKINR
jgi:hypothetical protein